MVHEIRRATECLYKLMIPKPMHTMDKTLITRNSIDDVAVGRKLSIYPQVIIEGQGIDNGEIDKGNDQSNFSKPVDLSFR